ncbi:MAG: PH domain-containing protein [Gammaproteobacteria bacterium]|nr:PH domain-containing protein [Gammaproteobacteria bacterium]
MSFAIVPPQTTATLLLAAIALGCLAIGLRLLLFDGLEAWTAWTVRGSGALVLALAGAFAYFLWGAFHSNVTIEGGSVRLQVPIYSVTIPLDSIDAERTKILNLESHRELKPAMRTNGLGVPGYWLGHFRLKNGHRARLALTTRSSAAYVPFDERTALLISVDQGEKFIEALKGAAAG